MLSAQDNDYLCRVGPGTPMGTLMRELVPASTKQVYYLVKPLPRGDLLSASDYAAALDAQSRAAGTADGRHGNAAEQVGDEAAEQQADDHVRIR